jgi:DNA-binding LacI/PurR family transcriptional regulator
VAMISGPQVASSIRDRQRGYGRAMAEKALEVGDLIRQGDLRPEGGYRVALELLRRPNPPTAVFSVNNQTTVGVLSAIAKAGLRIPNDISVVGFDDLSTAGLLVPPLSVVSQPTYELGAQAVRLLLERVEQPDRPAKHIVLPVSLRLRDSTGPPVES